MQRTRAIPVDWLSSGLCPNRPKGWIPIIIIIMYSWYQTLHVGRAKVLSSYRVMPAHHTPCGHKRDSTGAVPLILNFGTRQSGQLPTLTLTTEERAPAPHWTRGWVRPRVSLDILEKRKTSHTCCKSNPGSFSL